MVASSCLILSQIVFILAELCQLTVSKAFKKLIMFIYCWGYFIVEFKEVQALFLLERPCFG